ncbi:MAG: RNA recognition motif domain-containing protein [Candidatus Methylacidiphilales bacterium]
MKMFVGNLPFKVTEGELQDLFAQYGEVNDVFIPLDRATRRPRGFAFVTMDDDSAARKAIDGLNGHELGGRAINVNEARPRDDRGGR